MEIGGAFYSIFTVQALFILLKPFTRQKDDPNAMSMLDGSMIDVVSSKILPSSSSLSQIGEGIIEWAVSSRNQRVRKAIIFITSLIIKRDVIRRIQFDSF